MMSNLENTGTTPPASAPQAPVSAAPDWRAQLTGDYAALAQDKNLADIKGNNWEEVGPQLAKGMSDARKAAAGKVTIPQADASGKVDPAAQRTFWSQIGVPATVEGYKDVRLDEIEGLGPTNQALVEAAKPVFMEHGMTPQQGQAMLNLYGKVTAQQRQELIQSMVEGQGALEEKWGLNFERNTNLAQRALKTYFPKEFLDMFRASGLDYHPGAIEGLYEIGKNLAEGQFIEGEAPTVADNEATEKSISDLRQQMRSMNEGSPQLKEANQKLEALYKKRYGTSLIGVR